MYLYTELSTGGPNQSGPLDPTCPCDLSPKLDLAALTRSQEMRVQQNALTRTISAKLSSFRQCTHESTVARPEIWWGTGAGPQLEEASLQ